MFSLLFFLQPLPFLYCLLNEGKKASYFILFFSLTYLSFPLLIWTCIHTTNKYFLLFFALYVVLCCTQIFLFITLRSWIAQHKAHLVFIVIGYVSLTLTHTYLPSIFVPGLFYPYTYPLLWYAVWPELLWPIYYVNKWIYAAFYYFSIAQISLHSKSFLRLLLYLKIFHLSLLIPGLLFFDFHEHQDPEDITFFAPLLYKDKSLTYMLEDLKREIMSLHHQKPTKNIFIMPEGWLPHPLTADSLPIFSHLLPPKISLLAGLHYEEKKKEYNCVAFCNTQESKIIHSKTHKLPFIETHTLPEKKECHFISLNNTKWEIALCSEFLCQTTSSKNPILCMASDSWSKTWYLRFFILLMLMQARLQSLSQQKELIYCSPHTGLRKIAFYRRKFLE